MMGENIIPSDTRYVPIPQQPYCCGPASLTMVMIRHGLPLLPQELIGHHLGLVVPSNRANEFWNPRHAEKPVVASGFGTQIQNEKYLMQKALDTLNIPLRFEYFGADQMPDVDVFAQRVREIIRGDDDVMVCLNWDALTDQPEKNWGHVLCVDQIYENDVRLIDTDVGAKWRLFPIAKVYAAVIAHGRANYGGLWIFRKEKATQG